MVAPTVFEMTTYSPQPILYFVCKQKDEKDTRSLEQVFLFLKMKLFLANITDVVVSTDLFITHSKVFKANFPKAAFSFSPDSILDHLLKLGVNESFIKETFFESLDKENLALLTREKIIEKFEILRTNKGHKHKLSQNENFFTQCHQIFDFYKRSFDYLTL
jgi:hypothetical protein